MAVAQVEAAAGQGQADDQGDRSEQRRRFALTLRADDLDPPPADPRLGPLALLLSSVLALLALACFPVLAQADSGTIEYDPSLPSDGGAKQNENIAKSSESPNSGGAEAPPSAGSSESYPEEAPPSSESEGTASTGNGRRQGPG